MLNSVSQLLTNVTISRCVEQGLSVCGRVSLPANRLLVSAQRELRPPGLLSFNADRLVFPSPDLPQTAMRRRFAGSLPPVSDPTRRVGESCRGALLKDPGNPSQTCAQTRSCRRNEWGKGKTLPESAQGWSLAAACPETVYSESMSNSRTP